MTFRVGQKVVCVLPPLTPPDIWAGEIHCEVGKVYTVREWIPDDDGTGPAILVEEIINPPFAGELECGFFAIRFRPVVERKTDISALKRLLVPGSKIREDA